MRATFPQYAAIHTPILPDVLARLDRTYQAFFRRRQRGEKAGFPRFTGRSRFHSFTFKAYGHGARLENGSLSLVLAKIGRLVVHWSRPLVVHWSRPLVVHWSRPLEGAPKTVTVSREADGWYVAIACAAVSCQPLPATGRETGIDLGIESFAPLANGEHIFTPALLSIARLRRICAAASGG